MSRRTERVGNLIRNTVGQLLLTKLSDPRVDPAITSITRVEVPEDLLSAKVYISVIGPEAKQRTALRALSHAAGHIQELMGRQIKLRHTPILSFVLDKSFKTTVHTMELIQQAMEEIRQKENSEDPDESPDDSPTADAQQDTP